MMLSGEDRKGRPVYDYAYVEKVYDEMGRLLRDDNEKRQGVASLAAALSDLPVFLGYTAGKTLVAEV